MQIKDAIAAYLGAKRIEGCSPATLESFALRLRLFARFLRKRHVEQIAEVQPKDLDDYIAGLVRKKAAFHTRCAYIRTVRGFFRWLYEQGKLLTNPARDTEPPPENLEPLPPPPLTEDEVAQIMETMPRRNAVDLRNRLHLELFYSCGLRVTETLQLKLADINFEARSLRVLGKGGKVRTLPLMKGVLAALKDYLALRRSLLRGPDHGVLLVSSTHGGRLSDIFVAKLMSSISKRQRLSRRIHPHLFRHSIAVHLLQRGADIRHVQEFLGHSSIDTTKIYLRMVPGRLKEDYNKSMPDIAVRH